LKADKHLKDLLNRLNCKASQKASYLQVQYQMWWINKICISYHSKG